MLERGAKAGPGINRTAVGEALGTRNQAVYIIMIPPMMSSRESGYPELCPNDTREYSLMLKGLIPDATDGRLADTFWPDFPEGF